MYIFELQDRVYSVRTYQYNLTINIHSLSNNEDISFHLTSALYTFLFVWATRSPYPWYNELD